MSQCKHAVNESLICFCCNQFCQITTKLFLVLAPVFCWGREKIVRNLMSIAIYPSLKILEKTIKQKKNKCKKTFPNLKHGTKVVSVKFVQFHSHPNIEKY